MTLYSIQLFAIYSRAVGRRLVPRHRDTYIAPAKVTRP